MERTAEEEESLRLAREEKERQRQLRQAKKQEQEREKESKRLEKERMEQERLQAMRVYERQYDDECDLICGIDEVGRGPLAGPVVAAAVILPRGLVIPHVNDSKKLTEKMRQKLSPQIMDQALDVGIGSASPERIDEINILQATYEAMRQAVDRLCLKPDIILIDAVQIPGLDIPQCPIIKGDAKSISIACASIVAKVYRDQLMTEYDNQYPEYGFASNKGYGSAAHIEALRRYGPCPIHRKTFIGKIC